MFSAKNSILRINTDLNNEHAPDFTGACSKLAKKTDGGTPLPEAALKTDKSKLLIACTINLIAVSTVFMTQSIFLELSESFKIDITQARFSFSIVSLFSAELQWGF